MERGGVENIVFEHRIAHCGAETDAVAGKYGHVELRVLRNERLSGIGESGRERGDKREGGTVPLAGGPRGLKEVLRGRGSFGRQEVVRHGDVPRLARSRSERHPHEPGGARIGGRRFRVEGELRRGLQLVRKRGSLVKRLHETVVVRYVRKRLEGGLLGLDGIVAEETTREGVQLELRADGA